MAMLNIVLSLFIVERGALLYVGFVSLLYCRVTAHNSSMYYCCPDMDGQVGSESWFLGEYHWSTY